MNFVKRSSPRGKAQHIIHPLSATQLTRKVQSSCIEACGGKHPRWQLLHMTLASFVSKNATTDREELVLGPRDSSRCFRQNLRLVAGMGRASRWNENHDNGRSDYMPWTRMRMDYQEQGMGQKEKVGVLGRPRASADCNWFRRRLNEQKSCRKLDTDHQREKYYKHCSRSIEPRELKEKQRCLPLLSFSRRDQEINSAGERVGRGCFTNSEIFQVMNLDDECRYLGYWGAENSDMRTTKEVVRQKIITARDLIKCHLHTRASNGIVHKQWYGSLPLLSGTHWVVWKWIEWREMIVRPSPLERLALATVNSKFSQYFPKNTCR